MNWHVVKIEPTFKACGGDHSTKKKPAERYAEFETAICWTKSRKMGNYKKSCSSFFAQVGENCSQYWAKIYWSYATKKEALDKVLYEAKHCGHYIRLDGVWRKVSY